MATIAHRETKYCEPVRSIVRQLGHATNADIHRRLRWLFPDVSATTVHRVTARLSQRGDIATAPPTPDGSLRFDANTMAHDHFMCASCGALYDINIYQGVSTVIESAIGKTLSNGSITVTGNCATCDCPR